MNYSLLSVSLFLMIYTEWLGVFFAAALFLYALFHLREKQGRIFLIISIVIPLLAISLTLYQYSQIAGLPPLLNAAAEKYQIRSGMSSEEGKMFSYFHFYSYVKIFLYYMRGYAPQLLFIGVLMFFGYFLRKIKPDKKGFEGSFDIRSFLLLSLVPVALHHILFFNFTSVHNFSALKTSVFISILIPILFSSVVSRLKLNVSDGYRMKKISALKILFVILIILCIPQYYYVNQRVSVVPKRIGEYIRDHALKEEVVFIQGEGFVITPQLIYYAHRNISDWSGLEQAKDLIKKTRSRSGRIFVLNDRQDEVIEERTVILE